MIISVSDALKTAPQENGNARTMTADLALNMYQGDLRVPVNANMPKTGAFTNFMYGLIDTTEAFLNDTPEQVRLLGGQSQVVLGGLKNDRELIKRGQMNLQTATRNLQFNQQQRDMLTPESTQDSFGYTLGSGVSNYATMVVGGYGAGTATKALTGSAKISGKVAGAASLGTMGTMEIGGEAQERAQKYVADTKDTSFKSYDSEKGLKNLTAEVGYGTVSMIMEKYLGYGEQKRIFSLDLAKLRNPKLRATASLTKTGVKAGVSETVTEFAQSLANIGIDLIDGTMNWEQVPDRLKQELNGWAAAAVIGGTAGVGAGIYNRSRGIKIIKEELRGAVPEEDLERTAAAVFDSAAQKVSDVVSVELELSSELQTKHGAVMDSMQRAIKQAADESGAFTDVSEEELAQYIGDTSKLFADQVLAEANIRNVPIEEVIQASDIVYENGGIRLKSLTEGGETRVLANSSVNVEGELNQLPQESYDTQGQADINTIQRKYGNSKVIISALDEDANNTLFQGTWDAGNDNIYYQTVRAKKTDVSTQTDPKQIRADAKKYLLDIVRKQNIKHPVLGKIRVSKKGINELINSSGNLDKLALVPHLKELIETSAVGERENLTHQRKDSIVAFYPLYNDAVIDGKPYDVTTKIGVDENGNLFYTVLLDEKTSFQDSNKETKSKPAKEAINLSITPKEENVKLDYQNKPQPKGLYDAKKGVIKIFESADFSTLPHELAHYWLDNMWHYVRSGNASEKYRQRWNVIANWLNVKQEQAFLTRGQQEKFARGYEQYLLNGNLPTPIIKGAFDDYDRWLKRVYGDMNRLNVRLSEDAVRFFQSMTTGVLPPPAIKPSRKPRSKMTRAEKLREKYGIKAQDEQEKKAVEFVKESEKEHKIPENAESRTIITSNITEGEKGVSRVYSRETQRNIDTLQEIADIDLEYNKVNLEEQAKRAEEFVKNNLEEARKVVNGERRAPDNILDTAIRIAYEQEMLRIGNNAEYLRALKLHSSLQTLRGQEIVAEKISAKDITNPTYWINKVIANRTQKAASKIFRGFFEHIGGDSPIESYKKMIKKETAKIATKVLAEKTREGQQRVLNAELKRLRHEYNTGEQGELFQMPLEPLSGRNAKMYINEALNELFGATITPEENTQIIAKIEELDKSIANTLDETKNPSLETWQKISEMNNLVESLSPSPALQIATSIVGRGAMLASVKSPTLNIISNLENMASEAVVRRALSSIEGGATSSMVDRQVIKDYLSYADDVYKASGYNVSTLQDMDAAVVTLGERRITTQGKGKFREFARGVETGVFKYLMGYPDSISKDFVFSDVAALEATSIAMNEGLSGEALTNRATYLFKDATLVTPQTEEGQIIRDKAIMEANVATYTNDTAFSKFALGIRETLNKATGNLRLGDNLIPFAKTPANVVGLGIDYSIGAAYLIPNLPTVIRDIKAGKLSAKSRFAIKAAMRNGLGVVLSILIAMALDPDDYTPEYEILSPSEKRLAMEKNAVFNSIRIGDKYISLDYFGPLALPLAAVLTARKRDETAWFGYLKGTASQLFKTPGIQEFAEAADSIKRASADTLDETIKNLTNSMVDFIRARTIPSIVNDVAKSLDDYERETSVSEIAKTQNSIPFLREELPLKYGTTKPTPRETEPAIMTIFFGARVKTANSNRVIYEIDRLFKKGQRPTITDVTWSGKLSSLNEADQQRVRKEFARRYYDGVYKLINTRKYRGLDDEDKKNAINNVRRKIINELKNKYLD